MLGNRFVRGEAALFERVAERIVADIVQQGAEPDEQQVLRAEPRQGAAFGQSGEGPLGEAVGAEGVFEAGVGGAGVDEEGVAELADVAQALEGRCVDDGSTGRLQGDVLPEQIANDDVSTQMRGPASRTLAGTPAAYFSKFFWNSPASRAACAS